MSFTRVILDRLLFTAIIGGLLLAGYAALRYVDLANRLSGNMAAQIHESGGEVELESKGQAQGLMASDIERRRLVAEQFTMMVVGGVGLALLGLGWLGADILRGRRKKAEAASARLGDRPSLAAAWPAFASAYETFLSAKSRRIKLKRRHPPCVAAGGLAAQPGRQRHHLAAHGQRDAFLCRVNLPRQAVRLFCRRPGNCSG